MKFKVEKMILEDELQYVIEYIRFEDMLSFLQNKAGAKIIRSAEVGWDSKASLLEIKGFRFKLVVDDLGFVYMAAIKQNQTLNSQLEKLIQEFLPDLEKMFG